MTVDEGGAASVPARRRAELYTALLAPFAELIRGATSSSCPIELATPK